MQGRVALARYHAPVPGDKILLSASSTRPISIADGEVSKWYFSFHRGGVMMEKRCGHNHI
ncbi:hypothetical protein [Paraburkholderia sp. 40]|uniref:hypothetical protein n=1 Tax=Paraburkholderia sp. 40 TaxID=2991059 RepID=UPI003D1D576B